MMIFDGQQIASGFAVSFSSKYSKAVTTAVSADLNAYRAFARLGPSYLTERLQIGSVVHTS